MPTLPERPSLDWLKKTAKQHLDTLRATDPAAKLADAQRGLARDYGFPSWRKLKAHIDALAAPPAERSPDDIAAAFLLRVGEGDYDRVRAALAAAPSFANIVGPHPFWDGRPQPLHLAIERKDHAMIDLLLDAGADVNGHNQEYDHWSPLMLAINNKLDDVRALLIARGAVVGLIEALMLRDDPLVEELLRGGKLPDVAPNGGSILAFAKTPYAIARLFELRADAIKKDRWGASPVEAMSRSGPEGKELVRQMMLRGIVPAPQEFARLGDQDALETLVAADPSVVQKDAVMMGAVDFGHVELVRWLIRRGANVNARAAQQSRHTALHSAAWEGNLEMAQLLVAAGADINARDEEYEGTPAGWADTSITISNNPGCSAVRDWLLANGGKPS